MNITKIKNALRFIGSSLNPVYDPYRGFGMELRDELLAMEGK